MRIECRDGSILRGELVGKHAGSKEFLLKTEKGALQVSENEVSSVVFPVPRADGPRRMRAVFQDGSRVSGDVVKVEEGATLVLTVPGIQEPLRLPIAGLRSLVALRHEVPVAKK